LSHTSKQKCDPVHDLPISTSLLHLNSISSYIPSTADLILKFFSPDGEEAAEMWRGDIEEMGMECRGIWSD
jgi:hypothetical protein